MKRYRSEAGATAADLLRFPSILRLGWMGIAFCGAGPLANEFGLSRLAVHTFPKDVR